MNILVIGSSGFIGANTTKAFVEFGWHVDGADIIPGENDSLLRQRFEIDSFDDFNEIAKRKYDVIVNSAGAASVPFSFNNPFKDYELNTRIVFAVLDALRMHSPFSHFINFSSAAVYGNPDELPVREDQTIKPISPYGNHKWMSEIICEEFAEFFNLRTTSLRVFSAYGPLLKKQILWDLKDKALSSQQVELFGTGEETRDFIYISDLIEAIRCVIQGPKDGYNVYNIGNGKEVKIRDLATLFLDNFTDDYSLKFTGKKRGGDPSKWVADISRLRKLGYEQKVSLEEGVKSYCTWLKNL